LNYKKIGSYISKTGRFLKEHARYAALATTITAAAITGGYFSTNIYAQEPAKPAATDPDKKRESPPEEKIKKQEPPKENPADPKQPKKDNKSPFKLDQLLKKQKKAAQKTPAPQTQPYTPQKTSPIYIDTGAGINSNKTTKGNTQHASYISDFLNGRGFNQFTQYKDPQNNHMISQTTTSGYGQIKPLAISKLAEIAGIDVSKDVVDFLDISAVYTRNQKRDRNFTQGTTQDTEFKTTTDTSTKDTITTTYAASKGKITLPFFSIESTPFINDQEIIQKIITAEYNENLSDPSADYSETSIQELESKIKTKGIQGILSYRISSSATVNETQVKFKGELGLFVDYSQTEQEITGMEKQTLESTIFGLVGQGNLAQSLAFNFGAFQELFQGPGDENDGWQTTSGYATLMVQPKPIQIKNKQGKTTEEINISLLASAWYRDSKIPGIGGMITIGTGNPSLEELNNISIHRRMEQLGLNRQMGEDMSEFETERIFRTLPLTTRGVNLYAYGEAEIIKDENLGDVWGAYTHAGITAWKLAIGAQYADNHIKRKIGGYFHADLNIAELLIGFFNETDKFKKDESKTGEIAVQIPIG